MPLRDKPFHCRLGLEQQAAPVYLCANRTQMCLGEKRKMTASLPIRPVVLCGGSGTRLWPLSRSLHPKQLLPIAHTDTMLQTTVYRTRGAGFAEPVIVTGEDHRFMVKDQLAEGNISPAAIVLEPSARNTAAAIALAALWLERQQPGQIMLIMPSDHVVQKAGALIEAIKAGRPLAEAGKLVTFGIKPERAETGYGYIEAGEPTAEVPQARTVARFVEKPDHATAEAYVAGGRHYWNGGIFLFRADAYLDELRALQPDVLSACEAALVAGNTDGLFFRPGQQFVDAPSISVDYAVMEKTSHAVVIPVDLGWSDVGSWEAVWDIGQKDADGNVLQGEALALHCRNTLLRSDTDMIVAGVGLEDMVVVASRDAVLIVPRERSQDTKLLVDALRESGSDLHMIHTKVHRPWGTYETTDRGDRFQTKRIIVKPGEKLSLQMHHHRSEHWIVVRGTARVTINDRVQMLQENESTYIPVGATHRLENPGKIPLELIEVQCGGYLGEDDIVRFEDTYGRLSSIVPATGTGG